MKNNEIKEKSNMFIAEDIKTGKEVIVKRVWLEISEKHKEIRRKLCKK